MNIAAPITAPYIVPMPPITTIRRISTMMMKESDVSGPA
ncbi:Uncharacterised protein [Mycobacterium tuberculosis]|nr:Uncharacterised protein [Mycobacterium tuberculosis]